MLLRAGRITLCLRDFAIFQPERAGRAQGDAAHVQPGRNAGARSFFGCLLLPRLIFARADCYFGQELWRLGRRRSCSPREIRGLHCVELHGSQINEGSPGVHAAATQPVFEVRHFVPPPAAVGFQRVAGSARVSCICSCELQLFIPHPPPHPPQPPICIYLIPSERGFFSFRDEDRLPSASTCFNLLKLPPYKSSKASACAAF